MQVLTAYNTTRVKSELLANATDFRFSSAAAVVPSQHLGAVRHASGLSFEFSDGAPVPVRLTRARARQLALKRAMDVVLSVLTLLVLAPALVLLAIAIRLTSTGPALFRQDRDGLNGTVIAVYKFRSMYVDGVQQARYGRRGVTPLGRFIRRTSIDELPQLWNVIRGDMSLVGPRPHPIGLLAAGAPYKALVPYYHARHVMKPGISGWAQANGLRGPTGDPAASQARIEHDIAYIQNFSLLLDIRIMIRTVLREFVTGTGY